MSDIELVIKIPKQDYELACKCPEALFGSYAKYIKNGTLLPKDHGRLGDLDALEKEMIGGIKKSNYEEGYEIFLPINNVDDCVECVRFADTIIEADKENNKNI